MRNLRSAEEIEQLGSRKIRVNDDDTERKPQVDMGEPEEDKGEDIILQAWAVRQHHSRRSFIESEQNEGPHTEAWIWKNIRTIRWTDLYMLKN